MKKDRVEATGKQSLRLWNNSRWDRVKWVDPCGVTGKPPLVTPVGVMPDKSTEVMATRIRMGLWQHDTLWSLWSKEDVCGCLFGKAIIIIGCWISTVIPCEKTVSVIWPYNVALISFPDQSWHTQSSKNQGIFSPLLVDVFPHYTKQQQCGE